MALWLPILLIFLLITTNEPATTMHLYQSNVLPHQNGMIEGCDKFHQVGIGEVCDDITKANNISFEEFIRFNPAVGSSCQNLQANVFVCVSYNEQLADTYWYDSCLHGSKHPIRMFLLSTLLNFRA